MSRPPGPARSGARGLLLPGLVALTALAWASGPAPASAQQPSAADSAAGGIAGQVFSEMGARPLARALVVIETEADLHLAVTDARGRYALEGLPAGPHRVRVSAPGHEPLGVTVEVAPATVVHLDLSVPIEPIGMPAIEVLSHPSPDPVEDDVTRGSPGDPEVRALGTAPGVAGIGGAAAAGRRGSPGDPLDPASTLFVRGAASDLKLVLLDGAPVYAPFHLGGLAEAFIPDVLASARMYVGGAPARYDGGLSYVLDLTTRPGSTDRVRTGGAVDLIRSRARAEAPLGDRSSLLVAGRTLHGDPVRQVVGASLPYGYSDGLARLDLGLGEEVRLSATGFANRESIAISPSGGLRGAANWGNLAGSVRLETPLGDGEGRVTAAVGRFDTELPLRSDTFDVAAGVSLNRRVTAEYRTPMEDAEVAYGATYEHQEVELEARSVAGGGRRALARSVGELVAAFADATWHPSRQLRLAAGVRAGYYVTAGEARLAPRLSATWLLDEASSLSFTVGRFQQYVRAPETVLSGDLGGWTDPTDGEGSGRAMVSGSRSLDVAGASHFVLGLEHAASRDLRLGFEGFFKAFDHGRGLSDLRASGVDLWLDFTREEWQLWAGYSLAWAWTEGAGVDTASSGAGAASSDRFSGRQLLSGGLRAPLPSGLRLDLQLAHSSGLPFTSLPTTVDQGGLAVGGTTEFGDRDEPFLSGAPDGSYVRLDAEISRPLRTDLLGREMRLVPYVRVLNALDTRDALFYRFEGGDRLRPESLDAVPLLPVVGLAWEH